MENNYQKKTSANDGTSGDYYSDLGKTTALDVRASPSSLRGGLAGAYAEFQKREKNFTKERITQFEAEIHALLLEKNKAEAEIHKNTIQQEHKNDDIQDKKEELQKVRSEGVETNSLPFIIGTVIISLLTLYLFLFYASTGYSAFFGIPSQLIGGFLAPTVFEDAQFAGNGALLFIVLFPIVFLAMGFLVHIFIEKKSYFGLLLILMFTLAFDMFMAYKIAKNAHQMLFQSIQGTQNWTAKMAYEDINFYIIIAAGFVVYVIWGYLLNFVINQWYATQPTQAKQAEIEKIKSQILKLTTETSELSNVITLLQNNVLKTDTDKAIIENKVNILKGGGIVIDITALKGMVGEYIGGWCLTIHFLFNNQKEIAEERIIEANEKAEEWLGEIVTSLKIN